MTSLDCDKFGVLRPHRPAGGDVLPILTPRQVAQLVVSNFLLDAGLGQCLAVAFAFGLRFWEALILDPWPEGDAVCNRMLAGPGGWSRLNSQQ